MLHRTSHDLEWSESFIFYERLTLDLLKICPTSLIQNPDFGHKSKWVEKLCHMCRLVKYQCPCIGAELSFTFSENCNVICGAIERSSKIYDDNKNCLLQICYIDSFNLELFSASLVLSTFVYLTFQMQLTNKVRYRDSKIVIILNKYSVSTQG